MIVSVIVSDRDDLYLPGCIDSWNANVHDSCAPYIVFDNDHELGMAGAVRSGFEWALSTPADYILWVEEDFRFNEPVDLDGMRYVLDHNPHLAQVVLKRQPEPLNPQEANAGGIVEANPNDYTECKAWGRSIVWTEHSRIFSLNPCLIPRRVLELGWPDGNEAGFTQRCLDAGYRFAFYGGKFDPPRVEHVGKQRSVGWRL